MPRKLFEKLKNKNTDKIAQERATAFVPESEIAYDETAASKIDSTVVDGIVRVKHLLNDRIESQTTSYEDSVVVISSEKASGQMGGAKLVYDAITSSSFNDPGAHVAIIDDEKKLVLSAYEDYNLGLKFSSISIDRKDEAGEYTPDKRLELQSGGDERSWSWTTIVTHGKGESSKSATVAYDTQIDEAVRDILVEASETIEGLRA